MQRGTAGSLSFTSLLSPSKASQIASRQTQLDRKKDRLRGGGTNSIDIFGREAENPMYLTSHIERHCEDGQTACHDSRGNRGNGLRRMVRQIYDLRKELRYFHTVNPSEADVHHRNPGYFDGCKLANHNRRFGKGNEKEKCFYCHNMSSTTVQGTLSYNRRSTSDLA